MWPGCLSDACWTPPSSSPRFPADALEELRGQTKLLAIPKGELLFSQGDASEELFVIAEGRIAIATRSSDGRESMVAVLEAGGLFGELGLFDDEPRSADARALTDSEVVALAYEDVRACSRPAPRSCGSSSACWPGGCATDEALADAVFLDVPARTAKRLLELAGDRIPSSSSR